MQPGEFESGTSATRRDPTVELSLLTTLVHDAPVGIAFLDREYRYRLVNTKQAELNDVPIEAHIGRTVADVLPHIWPRLKPIYDEVLATGRPITDVALSGRAGSRSEERHWLAGYYPIRDGSGSVTGIGVVMTETTDQVRAEQEVRRLVEQERSARESIRMSEEHLRAVLSAIPDFIFHLSADGTHIDFYAPDREDLFVSPTDFVGRRVRDVVPAGVADLYEAAIARTLETGAMQNFEYAIDYAPGDRRIFDARMVRKSADEVLAMVRNVTDVKALENQLRQSQKMEAIGQLAGGVAHDFNNLLTVINGYSEMLESYVEEGPAQDLVAEIRKAGEHAASLTRQLLLFSRQQRSEPRIFNVNTVVEQAEKMLRRLIGADVLLTTDLDPDLPSIRADPGQIEQVLVNLSVNARDAMPQGGRLELTTRLEAPAAGGSSSASWVTLSVRDTGSGMERHVRERIFEPFFTTKPPGQGTGLGLAVVFGVVQECGGTIDVDSAPGRGTTLTLRFPVAAATLTSQSPAEPAAMPRGRETILVVEDDAAVRGLAVRALERCGYTVLEAEDGAAALRLAASSGAIDLVVSDVVMPHMSGNELKRRLRAMRPHMEVLLVSGYHQDVALQQAASEDALSFLQKPFTPARLATRVRELLDRRAARGSAVR